MNLKRVCILSLVLFAAYTTMEFMVHGWLLADMYKDTSSVWRQDPEMKSLFWLMLLGQLFFAKFFAVVFTQGYEKGKPGLGQGLRCGLIFGLLLAPVNSLIWYVILPIPVILAVYWFAAGFVEMTVLGLIAGTVYKP